VTGVGERELLVEAPGELRILIRRLKERECLVGAGAAVAGGAADPAGIGGNGP